MKQFIGAIIGIIVIWFFSSNKGTEQNVTKQIEDHKNKVKEGQEAIREEMRQKEVGHGSKQGNTF